MKEDIDSQMLSLTNDFHPKKSIAEKKRPQKCQSAISVCRTGSILALVPDLISKSSSQGPVTGHKVDYTRKRTP